jgi:hypothetical protein
MGVDEARDQVSAAPVEDLRLARRLEASTYRLDPFPADEYRLSRKHGSRLAVEYRDIADHQYGSAST